MSARVGPAKPRARHASFVAAVTPRAAAACSAPVDDLLDPELFKALCDPTRLRMAACLMKCGRACSVTEIAACCHVDLSVISRHLRVLARAGVVDAVKRGREVYYAVRFQHLIGVLRSLADAVEQCCPEPGGCSCDPKGGCCGTC